MVTGEGGGSPPKKKGKRGERGPYKKIPDSLKGNDGPRQAQLNILAGKVVRAKAANGGRLPRNFMKRLLGDMNNATQEELHTKQLNEALFISKKDIDNAVTDMEKDSANLQATIVWRQEQTSQTATVSTQTDTNQLSSQSATGQASSQASTSQTSTASSQPSQAAAGQPSSQATNGQATSQAAAAGQPSSASDGSGCRIDSSSQPASEAAPEGVDCSVDPPPPRRNKGGRPKGSTDANKRAKKKAKKQAINWIAQEYSRKVDEIKAAGGSKVPDGFIAGLIKQAIERDEHLDDSFKVSTATIHARYKTGRHTVWHSGTSSPVEAVEPVLVAMITKAAELNAPLKVSQCKAAMNELLKGTKIEADIIAERKEQGCYNPDKPLLGNGWWRGFKRRNKALVESSVGKKYARNRSEHCTYDALLAMYKRVYDAMVESGNARRLEEPRHVDREGNVVENALSGWGYPINIEITDPKNIFVLDETVLERCSGCCVATEERCCCVAEVGE